MKFSIDLNISKKPCATNPPFYDGPKEEENKTESERDVLRDLTDAVLPADPYGCLHLLQQKETRQTTNIPNIHTTYSRRLPKIVLRLSQDGPNFESGLRLHIHNKNSRHSQFNRNQPGQGGSTTHSSQKEKY